MKTKTYVGIALVIFTAILLVIFSAGFTQKKMQEEQTINELLLREQLLATQRQENCTIVNLILDDEVVMTVNVTSPVTNTTKNTTITTPPKNTTPTVITPKPRPKPVTRAS